MRPGYTLLFSVLASCWLLSACGGQGRQNRQILDPEQVIGCRIVTEPAGATITVDGVAQSNTTPAFITVPTTAPVVRVELTKAGYQTATLLIDLQRHRRLALPRERIGIDSDVLTFARKLMPDGQGIYVSSNPPGAMVIVDDQAVGTASLPSTASHTATGQPARLAVPLTVGDHQVTLRRPPFPDCTSTISVRSEEWHAHHVDIPLVFRSALRAQQLEDEQAARRALSGQDLKDGNDTVKVRGLFIECMTDQYLRIGQVLDVRIDDAMVGDLYVTKFHMVAEVDRPQDLPAAPLPWRSRINRPHGAGVYRAEGWYGSFLIPDLSGEHRVQIVDRNLGKVLLERTITIRPDSLFRIRHLID